MQQARQFRELCLFFHPSYRGGFTLTLRQIDLEPLLIGIEFVKRSARFVLLPCNVFDHVTHMGCVIECVARISSGRVLDLLAARDRVKSHLDRSQSVDLVLQRLLPRHSQISDTARGFIRTLLESFENRFGVPHDQ